MGQPDPMMEKQLNAQRRACADALHALARKIENGTFRVIEFRQEFEHEDVGIGNIAIPKSHPTGIETFTVRYDTNQGGRR